MTERYLPSKNCRCERCSRGPVLGGAVLLTLGGLFLLREFTHLSFQWPVLLIVIGVVMVWQHAASTEGHVPPSSGETPAAPPPPPSSSEPPQVPNV
jgi:hypothetical protein